MPSRMEMISLSIVQSLQRSGKKDANPFILPIRIFSAEERYIRGLGTEG